ncbi:DUF192 domain-containing protein [Aliidiomarina taiwanensis]|nr:DUF192 domain-containing protein [Aliidiomarina taiwanensis]
MRQAKHKEVQVAVNEQLLFRLRVANTFRQRLLGWRVRGSCHGMWLLPCRSIHTFGMRIPLDLLWLTADLTLARLDRQVTPYRLSRCSSAFSVIELPAGVVPAKVNSIRLVTQGGAP